MQKKKFQKHPTSCFSDKTCYKLRVNLLIVGWLCVVKRLHKRFFVAAPRRGWRATVWSRSLAHLAGRIDRKSSERAASAAPWRPLVRAWRLPHQCILYLVCISVSPWCFFALWLHFLCPWHLMTIGLREIFFLCLKWKVEFKTKQKWGFRLSRRNLALLS